MTTETPGNDTAPATVIDADTAPIITALEDVQDDLNATPTEDRDDEWRKDLLSKLAELKTELGELKADKGKSPELSELTAAVSALSTQVAALTPTQVTPSPSVEAESPSLETPPATSSETAPKPKPKPKPETPPVKQKRVWL